MPRLADMNTPFDDAEESLKEVDLHPSLEQVVTANGLDRTKLSVGLRLRADKPDFSHCEEIMITDGAKGAVWNVSSFRALFRGDKQPPSMSGEPPPAYMPLFYFIERHVVTFSRAVGDKTDGEFEEAYSNLRRRPDGRPLSDLHSFLWQVAAGLMGIRPVSAAEFDAIFGRLARSASTFQMGLASRNYIEVLRQTSP
jgi:hypothetical protein